MVDRKIELPRRYHDLGSNIMYLGSNEFLFHKSADGGLFSRFVLSYCTLAQLIFTVRLNVVSNICIDVVIADIPPDRFQLGLYETINGGVVLFSKEHSSDRKVAIVDLAKKSRLYLSNLC